MYLIDTYNLLHAGSDLSGPTANLTVRKLCQFITTTLRPISVTLVLDGRAKPDEPSVNEFPSVSLVYSGAGIKADTVIAQCVERAPRRREITVVTNDRAVALHARQNFARAITCEHFIALLLRNRSRGTPCRLPPRKLNGSPTPGETEHWLREFGFTPPPQALPPPHAPANLDDPDAIDIDRLLGPRD